MITYHTMAIIDGVLGICLLVYVIFRFGVRNSNPNPNPNPNSSLKSETKYLNSSYN